MKALRLKDLTPGMVTAKPVHNLHGVLLLNIGVELSEKNIWIMRSWGVAEVWVEGGKDDEEKKDPESEIQLNDIIEKQMEEKFSEVMDNQVMVEIMRLSRKHLEKRLLSDARKKAPA